MKTTVACTPKKGIEHVDIIGSTVHKGKKKTNQRKMCIKTKMERWTIFLS